jgi:hypothetical protein
VRLDHLLSKEHLPAKVGEEPALPGCGGGVLDGGDTGESWPTTVGFLSTASSLVVGCGERGSGAVGGGVNTLLGPEKTTVCVGWFFG